MKVLVSGGTGFIGSRLALACRADGAEVVVLGLRNTDAERSNAELLLGAGLSIADVALPHDGGAAAEALGGALRGVDLVYHLAAAQHEAHLAASHFVAVNVEGTRQLLDAAAAAGVRRFVHAGTIGIYADCEGEVDEDTTPRPDNVYGRTKLAGERLVLASREPMGCTVIRVSETYGPGDARLLKLFRAVERGRFLMIGDGRNTHQPVYIDDLIAGFRLAAANEHAAGQAFILAGARAVSTGDMVAAVAGAVGRSVPRARLPMRPMVWLARLFEAVGRATRTPPPLHSRRLDFFRRSYRFSIGKAREVLAFEPAVSLDEGMRRTERWYRERGDLPGRDASGSEP